MRRTAFLLIILVLALSILGPETAMAQPSAATSAATWSSDIIYFNMTTIPETPDPNTHLPYPKNLTVAFNGSNTSFSQNDPIYWTNYSNTILAGSIGKSFAGSAVVSAEVPVVAVYKQVSSNSNPYSPILYTSFGLDQAGNGTFYVPSVRRSTTFVSQIGIQNIEAEDVNVTLNFYNNVGADYSTSAPTVIKSQNSWVFKLSDLSGFPTAFDGSLVITATLASNGNKANIVAVVQEVQSNGRQAFAYEGSASGAPAIYMASAMCNVGKTQQTTYYAIQNVDANSPVSGESATITYYDGLGNQVAQETTKVILPNHKMSVSTCDAAGTSGKTVMSAVITGASLVAMGKVQSNDGLMTAFLGSTPPTKTWGNPALYHVALPYVEWSNSALGFRSYIAVMNATGQPETNILVNYYRRNGKGKPVAVTPVQLANTSMPLAHYAKRNSEVDQVPGALDGSKSFLGAVVITSDQPIVVVVRVQRGVSGIPGITTLGEDYSGINVTADPNAS